MQSLEAQLTSVEQVQKQVFAFAAEHTLTPRGQKSMADAASKLRAAKAALSATVATGNRLRTSSSLTEVEVKKLEEASLAPLAGGVEASALGRSLLADASAVDTAAEQREKKTQEAEAAALAAAEARAVKQAEAAKVERARRDAAEAAAVASRAAAAAAEATRKEKADIAERERKAEAAARAAGQAATAAAQAEAAERARADEKARIAGAAQAQAEARMRASAEQSEKVQQQTAPLNKALVDYTTRAGESARALVAFLAHDNVTPAAKRDGDSLLQRLRRIEARSNAALGRVKDAERPELEPRVSLAKLEQVRSETAELERVTRETCLASTALIASPSSVNHAKPTQDAPAQASQPPPPPPPAVIRGGAVPSCEISFEPSDGSKGLLLSIDGGRAVPLPAKVQLGSGRHALSVRRGQLHDERTELFVCGRISVVPIEPPKSSPAK